MTTTMQTLLGKWQRLRGIVTMAMPKDSEALALMAQIQLDMEEIEPLMLLSFVIEAFNGDDDVDEAMVRLRRAVSVYGGNPSRIQTPHKKSTVKVSRIGAARILEMSEAAYASLPALPPDDRQKRLEEMAELVGLFKDSVTPWLPELCLTLRTSCDCGYRGLTTGDTECPECGRIRFVCRRNREDCAAHRKAVSLRGKAALTSRADRYAKAFSSDHRRALSYVQMMQDENPLTIVPEITALGTRQAELLESLGEFGYTPDVAKRITRLAEAMMQSTNPMIEAQAIIESLVSMRDAERVWSEFARNASLLNKMIGAQNKHAVAQQEMVSRDQFRREKIALIGTVREAVVAAAERYAGRANTQIIEGEFSVEPDELSRIILGEIVTHVRRIEAATGMGDDER